MQLECPSPSRPPSSRSLEMVAKSRILRQRNSELLFIPNLVRDKADQLRTVLTRCDRLTSDTLSSKHCSWSDSSIPVCTTRDHSCSLESSMVRHTLFCIPVCGTTAGHSPRHSFREIHLRAQEMQILNPPAPTPIVHRPCPLFPLRVVASNKHAQKADMAGTSLSATPFCDVNYCRTMQRMSERRRSVTPFY